jgi:hypothetical protein
MERKEISRRVFVVGGSLWASLQLEASSIAINPFQLLTSAISSEMPKIEEILPEIADLSTEMTPTPIPSPSPSPSSTPIPSPTASPTPDNPIIELQKTPETFPVPEKNEEQSRQKESHSTKEPILLKENALIKPVVVEAEKRRAQRIHEAQINKDKDYLRRVDWELNSHYVNVVVFSCGEIYEPPIATTPGIMIATPTIFSINRKTGKIASVTISHDLRVPEMEKIKGIFGKKNSAQKLDSVVMDSKFGGFEMSRLVLENATGLSADFQVIVKDIAIQKLIDFVFDGLDLKIPFSATLAEYYLYGKLHQPRKFHQGQVRLNGTEAVGFIKAIPKTEQEGSYYGWELENSQRQFLVIEALRETLFQKLSLSNRNFYRAKLAAYLLDETMINRDIKFDFDAMTLGLGLLDEIIKGSELVMPTIGRSAYVVDPSCAKEPTPIHWVDPNHLTRSGEEQVAEDYRNGIFPNLGFEVPYGGNPHGDLIDNYYRNIRVWVRNLLINQL